MTGQELADFVHVSQRLVESEGEVAALSAKLEERTSESRGYFNDVVRLTDQVRTLSAKLEAQDKALSESQYLAGQLRDDLASLRLSQQEVVAELSKVKAERDAPKRLGAAPTASEHYARGYRDGVTAND
jgi:ABC-type transporter Mla subunit MlaD